MAEVVLKKYRKLVLATLGIILLLCTVIAGKWGIAAVSHDIALNHLLSWQKQKIIGDLETWGEVDRALKFAIYMDEDNADYHNDLGRFYEYTARFQLFDSRKNIEMQHAALEAFRIAVTLRPFWSAAWANLLLMKHTLQMVDDEFESALTAAVKYGVALSDVQEIVVEAGIANWLPLSKGARNSVKEAVHAGLMQKNKHFIVDIMNLYHMKPYFCVVLPDEDKEKICC